MRTYVSQQRLKMRREDDISGFAAGRLTDLCLFPRNPETRLRRQLPPPKAGSEVSTEQKSSMPGNKSSTLWNFSDSKLPLEKIKKKSLSYFLLEQILRKEPFIAWPHTVLGLICIFGFCHRIVMAKYRLLGFEGGWVRFSSLSACSCPPSLQWPRWPACVEKCNNDLSL